MTGVSGVKVMVVGADMMGDDWGKRVVGAEEGGVAGKPCCLTPG